MMNRLSRLDKSIDRLRPRGTPTSPSSFLCSTYGRTSPFSISARRCDEKENTDFSERMRRKIWGTDSPPGAADPYGSVGFVQEQVAKRNKRGSKRKQEDAVEQPLREQYLTSKDVEIMVEEVTGAPPEDSYRPATTWKGLLRVGHDPILQFHFDGFISKQKSINQTEAEIAIHRAIVETLIIADAGLDLCTVGAFGAGKDVTRDVQITLADGITSLQFSNGGATKEEIIRALTTPETGNVEDETAVKSDPTESEEDVAADRSVVDPLQAEKEIGNVKDETAVKSDPTDSEEEVAADRSVVDPLQAEQDEAPVEFDPTESEETATKPESTESEEEVAADRSTVDPLKSKQYKANINNQPTKSEIPPKRRKRVSGLKLEAAQALVASWDPVWKNMSLESPEIKFAIIKRCMQLTGIRIHDPNINSINSIQTLIATLIQRPKPRKLVQALEGKVELTGLANVNIVGRRITVADKEKSIGRYKEVGAELRRKGLYNGMSLHE